MCGNYSREETIQGKKPLSRKYGIYKYLYICVVFEGIGKRQNVVNLLHTLDIWQFFLTRYIGTQDKLSLRTCTMAIPVVEFSNQGYKIRKIFA